MSRRPSLGGLLAALLLAPVLVVLGWSTGSPAFADDTYTPTSLPGPTAPLPMSINDVDCWSPGNCVAVGSMGVSGSSQSRQVLYQETDGVWGTMKSPTPVGGSPAGEFLSVSCPSAGTCVAVGRDGSTSGGTSGLVATLSGGDWSAIDVGLGNGYTQWLVDVSCATSTSCAAVGFSYTSNGPQRAMAARLAGGTWSAEQVSPLALPGGAAAERANLTGVSCYAAGTCVAVGKSEAGSGASIGLIAELSSGTWAPQNASQPASSAANSSQLFSVSCASSGRCAAAGEYLQSGGPPYYVTGEVLDRTAGGAWSATAAPKPANAEVVRLTGTSCADDATCAVVGTASIPYNAQVPTRPSGQFPVIETRTASDAWAARTVDLPHPVGPNWNQTSALYAVSCVDEDTCVATGNYNADSNDDGNPDGFGSTTGLIVDVDPTAGTTTAQGAPLPSDASTTYQDVPLRAVRCFDVDHCTTAGDYVYNSPNGDGANGLALETGGTVQPGGPTISSISPKAGPKKGGTKVTVKGSGFVDVVNVKFGSAKGLKVKVIDDETLTVKTPKHKPGKVTVKVKTTAGKAGGVTFRYK